MASKPKFKEYVSPVGKAKLAFLHKPSAPFKEGDTPKFKVTLLIEDTTEHRAWVDAVVATALEEAKKHGVKMKKVFHNPFILPEDVDEDNFIPQDGKDRPKYDEDYRGKIIFEAKTQYQPGLIDTAKQALTDDVKIYGGDMVRVKVEAQPYLNGSNSGITLRLITVQLVEKNTSYGGSRGPNTDGFDDIDGYVAGGDASDDDDEIPF